MKGRLAITAINAFGADFKALENCNLPPNRLIELPPDSKFTEFRSKSAKEQIDLMAKRVEEVCEELQKKEPNSSWIIGWHEMAISDRGVALNITNKDYLLSKMSEIVRKYPQQLTIKIGPV